jgi:hypothetical protein
MTANRGPDTHRLKWIATLAALVYPQEVSKAADALKAFLPLLSDLPDGAFSAASLEAVVMAPRRMAIPSYDELRTPLAQWWSDHRPQSTITDDNAGGLDATARGWVDFYHKRLAEGGAYLASLRSLIRQQSTAADLFITAHHAVSDEQDRTQRHAQLRAEWGDIPTVRRALRCLADNDFHPVAITMLHGLLEKWAPQNLAMLEAAIEHRAEEQRAVEGQVQ